MNARTVLKAEKEEEPLVLRSRMIIPMMPRTRTRREIVRDDEKVKKGRKIQNQQREV